MTIRIPIKVKADPTVNNGVMKPLLLWSIPWFEKYTFIVKPFNKYGSSILNKMSRGVIIRELIPVHCSINHRSLQYSILADN